MQQTGFHLRPATHEDKDVVFHLFAQVQTLHADAEPDLFFPPEKGEAFEGFLQEILDDPKQHLLLASIGKTAVAYILYAIESRRRNMIKRERKFLYIHQLVVDASHRKNGYGSKLLEHAKQDAKKRDIAMVGIDYWWFNDAARASFAKAGFKVKQEMAWLA